MAHVRVERLKAEYAERLAKISALKAEAELVKENLGRITACQAATKWLEKHERKLVKKRKILESDKYVHIEL